MTELNELALSRAREAYHRKYTDMNRSYPTEFPTDGGGPLGYAIAAAEGLENE